MFQEHNTDDLQRKGKFDDGLFQEKIHVLMMMGWHTSKFDCKKSSLQNKQNVKGFGKMPNLEVRI